MRKETDFIEKYLSSLCRSTLSLRVARILIQLVEDEFWVYIDMSDMINIEA